MNCRRGVPSRNSRDNVQDYDALFFLGNTQLGLCMLLLRLWCNKLPIIERGFLNLVVASHKLGFEQIDKA
ncbi:hypothetical protein SUGI_0725110 [Cryptomeria japonica]|nr:hypothetical protein SUGI_0725110 [Cryptomeria japonica]